MREYSHRDAVTIDAWRYRLNPSTRDLVICGDAIKTKAAIAGGLEFSPNPQGHQHDAIGDASVIPHGAKEERACAPQRPSESVMIQRER